MNHHDGENYDQDWGANVVTGGPQYPSTSCTLSDKYRGCNCWMSNKPLWLYPTVNGIFTSHGSIYFDSSKAYTYDHLECHSNARGSLCLISL